MIIKWTMVLIYSALSLIMATFLLALVLPLVLNPNNYKSRIEAIVLEKSGRNMQLAGDVEWELFPNPTITLKELTVSNAAGFRAEPMLKIRRLQGRLPWQNLWRGRWLLEHPVATGVELLLESDAAGRNNWDDLLQRMQGGAQKVSGTGAPDADTLPAGNGYRESKPLLYLASQLLAVLTTHEVTIKDGVLRYCAFGVEEANCALAEHLIFAAQGKAAGVQLKADLQVHTPPLSGRFSMAYQPQTQEQAGVTQWQNLQINWRGKVDLPPAKEVELVWRSDVTHGPEPMRVHLQQMDSRLTVWSEAALFRELSFVLRGAALADGQTGKLQLPQGGLLWRIKSDQLPPAGVEFALQSAMELDWRQERLDLAEMQVIGPAQSRIEGSLHGTGLWSQPHVQAQLRSFRFDPRALLVAMGRSVPAIADPAAMRSGSGSADIQWHDQQLSIADLALEMDGSRWRGELSWQAGVQSATLPQLRFFLHGDRVEIDRYLPPEWSGPQQAGLLNRSLLAPEWLLMEMPQQGLPKIALQGRVEVEELSSSIVPAADLSVNIAMQEQQLQLQPYRIALHNGVLESTLHWDERSGEPEWQVEKRLQGLQMEPLLRMQGNTRWLTGRINGVTQLRSHGVQMESVWENLQGSYTLTLEDGVIHGVDLADRWREGARMLREPRPALSAGAEKGSGERRLQTAFSQISGSGRIAAGLLENSDLQINATPIQATGRGNMDLRRGVLDYMLEVEGALPLSAELANGQRLLLPVRLQGEIQSWKGPVFGALRAAPLAQP
ncbi:AsmA family protein [Candidatus Magnetaquicoccus inordinatus]|uniref:AsmA family protein n=1 Tax=Candidatus Magnetaquicoccus inordinatus TaxID=2496818 RepID=UPI00102C4619|nr:AsmA family protein [Candidatus Magnetaquicoccus inordinatus]